MPTPAFDSDTDPRARRVWIELLRRATPAQRISRVRSLTATTIALAKRALRRRFPDLSDSELELRFVAANYGEELARHLRAHRGAES